VPTTHYSSRTVRARTSFGAPSTSQEGEVTKLLQVDHALSLFHTRRSSALYLWIESNLTCRLKVISPLQIRVQTGGSQPSPEALARLVGMHTAAVATTTGGGTAVVGADETSAVGMEVREDGTSAAAAAAAAAAAVKVEKARADAAAAVRDPKV
jgi:hypothetical protein